MLPHSSPIQIRNYQPRDREAVRRLCCDTGFLGKPIDPVFEDRKLFADYLTSYYTDFEPEASFVMEQDGVIKGYLLGSRRYHLQKFYNLWNNCLLFFQVLFRYRHYNSATKAYIRWICRNSMKEVPPAPRNTPHFHFNVLPEAQGLARVRQLLGGYLEYLRASGDKEVFGQVVTFSDRRGAKLFERYGFEVIGKKEITKYRKVYPEPVYLTTVLKPLNEYKNGI